MAILSPQAIAKLAPGSPLLGATPDVLEGLLIEAQLIAEGPEAAARPLEQQELRDVLRVGQGNIVTPNHFPLSARRPPFLEISKDSGRSRLIQWESTEAPKDWQVTRRGDIQLDCRYPVKWVRLAYVAGFDFEKPEDGTEDLVEEIQRHVIAIAEQTQAIYQAALQGDRFVAEGRYSVKLGSPGRFGSLKAKSDAAKISLRKFRSGYGPIH